MQLILKNISFSKITTILAAYLFTIFHVTAQTVICPTETNLGPFDCNTIGDVPPQINSLADAMEVYGIEITGALPITRATFVDSDIIFYCESDTREVIREVVIYNDTNFEPTGWEEIETCAFTITTVANIVAPTFTAPPDTSILCTLGVGVEVTGEPTDVSNNCTNSFETVDLTFTDSPPTEGGCPGESIFLRTWIATDACGNESEPQDQIITRLRVAPEFTVPADIIVPCGTDPMDESVTGSVADAYVQCEDVPAMVIPLIDENLTQENTPCPGATTYTKKWGAVNGCGDATIKSQIIIVDCSENACASETPSTVTVICPTVTNLGPFDCNTIGNVPPQVNTLADAMEVYGIEITGALPETGVTTIDSDVIFYCEETTREVIREVIIYNASNPSSINYDIIETCVFTVTTIADLEPPTFMDLQDVQLTNCFQVDFPTPIAVDNCSVFPIQNNIIYRDSLITENELCTKLILDRIWKVEDPCGNVSEQIQRIEVYDSEGPVFTVPADITVSCGTDPMDAAITGNVVDAYDECEDVEVEASSIIVTELTQENTPCPGSTVYTKRWTAVDDCGNQTTQDQLILVECPPDCSNKDACVGDILADPLPGECDCQIIEEQVIGCMDPICPNYDSNANCDIGCLKVFDLALVKEINATEPFTIGMDTVITFIITIYNQGDLTAQNIEIIDYIPSSLNLNDANWSQSGDKAVTSLAGPLEPGAAISIDIRLSLDSNATVGTYTNYAEIFGAEDLLGNPGIDIDSTPDMNNENDTYYSPLVYNDEDDHDGAEFNLSDNTPCNNSNAGKFCE